jgi:hypothetical protein
LLDYKYESGKKLIQTWVMHSWYRKGEDLAYEVFNKLLEERDDVALVVRRPGTIDVYDSKIDYSITEGLNCFSTNHKCQTEAINTIPMA